MPHKTKFVQINRADGGVSIMELVEQKRAVEGVKTIITNARDRNGKPRKIKTQVPHITYETYWPDIVKEITKAGIAYLSWKEIDQADIPTDRTFRDAWTNCPVNKIKVDMEKARGIHMNSIRKKRDKRLKQLDQRQYGSEFDAERQALRDIPQTLDLSKAQTPEELKAICPEELK